MATWSTAATHPTRRDFLRSSALAAGAAWLAHRMPGSTSSACPSLGVAAGIADAARLAAAGAEFLTESVGGLLVPEQDEAAFSLQLEKLKQSALPVLACNSFIRPPHLKCVGPDATPDGVLSWAETIFSRMGRAGGRLIVFGSAGSRQVPEGWPQERARAQFIELLSRMGPLAERHHVTVVLEQLQAAECNFINHLPEAAAIVRSVAHPHVRLLADFFHMARMGDTAADLQAACDVLAHVEIAEREERTAPGIKGDDFRPWLRVLRAQGYRGAISIEGRWQTDQLAPAFEEIRRQWAAV